MDLEGNEISLSPSIRDNLPLGIQQILLEQENSLKKTIDMWTPEAEKMYQKEIQSLCGKN